MAVLYSEDYDFYRERLELCLGRIRTIPNENLLPEEYGLFFNSVSNFIIEVMSIAEKIASPEADRVTELKKLQDLMREFTSDSYEESFLNPSYAVNKLGDNNGGLLSFLYADLTSIIPNIVEGDIENVTLFSELFVEVYSYFLSEVQEDSNFDFDQDYIVKELRDMISSFYLDNNEVFSEKSIIDMVSPENNYIYDILMNADLSNTDYLFEYGLPISDNEIGLSSYLAKLSQEEIDAMASVYVGGFVKGFEASGKDMSIKDAVKVEYPIGFERVARQAVKYFSNHDLTTIVSRDSVMSYTGTINRKRGTYTSAYNPQFVFDHKNDKGYYFDKNFYKRRLETTHEAFKKYKKQANTYAGPAVIEVFGERDFKPQDKQENYRFTPEQNQWNVEFASKSGQMVNEYIPGDEYSFTIIAFPLPSIVEAVDSSFFTDGAKAEDVYKLIFDETMKLNTLDYNLYQGIQQTIIDALDQGHTVHVTGSLEASNDTDLYVKLHELTDPSAQTNFENCVADVNIPVGEVFTSPVLADTRGLLHVKKVYLGDLQYEDLRFTIQDGMVTDYSCANFSDEAENKKLIYENILMRHETLPMGECAIGTNTVAYTMARKYGIESKLPILIAEKTGPHFAFGDTCYSHAEEVPMYNPDGKECIARDNECSAKRDTDMSAAYFNCHTDITIPYDELDKVEVILEDGTNIEIISKGRFVLAGTLVLNEALDA